MSDTGHRKELGDATEHMADALATGDPTAIRAAMGDHATALNSQATAMAASIAAPVYGQLSDIKAVLAELSAAMANSDRARMERNATFQEHIDTKFDRMWKTNDELADKIGGLRVGMSDLQAGFSEIGESVSQIKDEVAEQIRQLSRAAQARYDGIEAEIAGIKTNDAQKLARLAQIEQQVKHLTDELAFVRQRTMVDTLTESDRALLVAANQWVQANKEKIVLRDPGDGVGQ